jgi:hypothetical protein
MNQDNRVLARMQARDLTDNEVQVVCGGIHTNTACTFAAGTVPDGDRSECGGV